MTTRVWNGGRGIWSDPSRWTTTSRGPAGAPQPGDSAAIASGSVTVVGARGLDGSIYDGVAVTLGVASGDGASLILDGGDFNSFDSITALGSATIASEGVSAIAAPITSAGSGTTLTIAGDASAPNGLLLAHGGSVALSAGATLDLEGVITDEASVAAAVGSTVDNDAFIKAIGSAVTIGGALVGTGTIDVEDAATLTLDGSVAAGQTIDFGDVAGRLALAEPGSFAGAIAGFKPGDSLDVTAVPTTMPATGATYDAASGSLTLTAASGAVVASIANVQAAAGALAVAPDGNGGTFVTYANAPLREQEQIQGADRAMRADVVRDTMDVPGTSTPITGAGEKIGIISTSFNADGDANADAAAGYLPANADGTSAVQVLGVDPKGDDEGREMAEEIHQVAPGAEPYFAAAGSSQTSYAAAVAALQQAGCAVVANDYTALDGAMYQSAGPADVAVRQAVKAGVDVFTSGGNYAQSDLEQALTPQAVTLPDGMKAKAQIFDNGTPEEGLTVAGGTQARIDLQSTAPYEGVDNAGAPQTLDFEVFDASGRLVGTATDATEGANGTPTTDLYLTLPTATQATTYDLVVTADGQAAPPQGFKMILSSTGGTGRGPGGIIDDPAAGEGSGDERGVELVPGVNSVGASYFGNSAAFGGTPSENEGFTSSGPGTILDGPEGNPLSSPRSAGKLTFDAPDGVPVPNPDSASPNVDEDPFFGTSAAAPNAAAVTALMLQANPSLSTKQVTSILQRSAIDQGLPPGQQGLGLIQADRAVALAIGAEDTLSLDSTVRYEGNGTFALSGQASSPSGVKAVDITASVDGVATDLGDATIGPGGAFTFSDPVGATHQFGLTATLVDDAGGTTQVAGDFGLRAGLTCGVNAAREVATDAAGNVTATTVFRSGGSRQVDVKAAGQTIQSSTDATFHDHQAADTTFVFTPGYGRDVLGGFLLDGGDHDTLSLPSNDFSSFAEVLRQTSDTPNGATIHDPTSGDTLTLAGVSRTELSQHRQDVRLHG